MVHVDKFILLLQKKKNPHSTTFAILISLNHGNSLLLNQEIKNGWTPSRSCAHRGKKKKRMDEQQLKIKEPRLWEIQDGHLAFPSSLTDLIFIWWVKAFPGYSVNALTMSSPKRKKLCFIEY